MPLSDAQKSLHWNCREGWGAVCFKNRWKLEHGRMASAEGGMRGADFSQWHHKVWAFADSIARQNHRAVTPEDLRKGTYTLALGEAKSLTQFNNGDLDRVRIVFRLLIEPDDLKAVKDWLAYERFDQAKAEIARCRHQRVPCTVALPDDPGERRRHLFAIKNFHEAYVRKIILDRFAGQEPEDMNLSTLRELETTLKNRLNFDDRPAIPRAAPKPQAVEEPF